MHNTQPLHKLASLRQQIIVNRALALHRREIDTSWSWYYKLAFGFFDKSGCYITSYGRRLNHYPPPHDLSTTNLVINFPLQSSKDDSQR